MGEEARAVLDQVCQVERNGLEPDLARLGLREDQHVIQDLKQVLGGGDGRAQVALLRRAQLVQLQELEHAEHAVHGSPELMAHVGEERRLGPLSLTGGLHGPTRLRFNPLAFGDVADHPEDEV